MTEAAVGCVNVLFDALSAMMKSANKEVLESSVYKGKRPRVSQLEFYIMGQTLCCHGNASSHYA